MEQTDGGGRHRSIWIVCLLVAAAPAIMAATTWTPDDYFSVPLFYWRFFAPPIVLIEILAIGFSWAAGFRPVATIAGLPGWAAAALGTLIAVDVGDALFVAPSMSTAMLRGSITLIHLLFGLGVFHLLRTRRFDAYRMLWWTLLGGTIVYLAMMIAFVAAIAQPATFDWQRFGLGVVNIRHAGFYAGLGAAIALGIAATEPRPRLYWLAVFAATLAMGEFFWSGSRAPLVAIVVGTIACAALIPALRTVRLFTAFIVSLFGGALLSLINMPPPAGYGLLRRLTSTPGSSVNDMSSGRVDLWGGSLQAFLSRPFLGYGEGQYILVVPAAGSTLHHPHNALLQALIQWGAIGTLAFALLLTIAWWKLFRKTRLPGARTVPAFLAINMFIVYAVFDGILFFVYPMMIFAFLLAAGLAAGKTSPASA